MVPDSKSKQDTAASFIIKLISPHFFLTCYGGEPLSDCAYLYQKQEHHGMHVPFGFVSIHLPVCALYACEIVAIYKSLSVQRHM
jgi:hypothetical protein